MRNISIFRGVMPPTSMLGAINSYYFQELNSIPVWRKINNTTWVVVANLGAGSGGVGAIIHGDGTPQDVILDPVMGMHYINDLTSDFFWYDTQWNLIGNFNGLPQWIYQNGTPLVNPPTREFDGLQVVDQDTFAVWAYDGANWTIQGHFDRTAILFGDQDPNDFITSEMVYDGVVFINTTSSQVWQYFGGWSLVATLGVKILHDNIDGGGAPSSIEPDGTHLIDDTTQGLWHYVEGSGWIFDGYLRGVQYKRNGSDLGTNTVKSLDILVNDNANFELSLDGETLTLDLTNTSKGFAAITSVTPLSGGNVVVNDTNSDGLVLDECTVSSLTFVVHVLAMTGRNLLKPNVKLIWDNSPLGTAVPLTPHTTENLWIGQLQITLAAAGTIQVIHEDGDTDDCRINYLAPPEVTDLIFTANDYPLPNQTEYAAGRAISVTVTADQPFTHVELITGVGAATTSQTFTVASGLTATVGGLTNNRTDSADYPVIARVRTAALTYSAQASSTDFGTGDHIRTIKLNNTLPTTSWGTITYNNGFEALKGLVETATVVLNITNITLPTDTVSVTSPSPYDQLSIADPNVLGNKTVTRISGGYNVTNANLRVGVYKTSNDTAAFATTVVYIAETPQLISVRVQKSGVTNYTRLRSGGSYGSAVPQYPVLIESNQRLLGNLNKPTLVAGNGAFEVAPFVGSALNTIWTRQLLVSDLTARGATAFTSLVTKNLAGIEVNTLNSGSFNYTIGGFVERVITFTGGAVPDREAPIGTNVVDQLKLRATNLSKNPTHSYDITVNPLVTNDPIPGPFTYCITGNAETPVATGAYVYNNDSANALGNGSLDPNQWIKFEIEEQE